MRPTAVPHIGSSRSPRRRGLPPAVAGAAALALLACGCSAGTRTTGSGAVSGASTSSDVRIAITPSGASDAAPNRGLTVRATGGRITSVVVHTAGDPVSGTLADEGTVWHSRWALDVAQRYTVIATAADPSGARVTETRSFRTLAPKRTFSAEIIEGDGQSYGVGMPIIVYLTQPVADRAAVERALQVSSSRPVVGAWFWDEECRTAPVCLYFRPRHYWPAHTVVHFTGHLNGVEASPGVYGTHTLTQTFRIGEPLMVVADTADHYMNVIRNGKLFAHWPISTGRPGDETPDGSYLTIEKANPVDMVGPGYNIEVPWSVRFTWSGDYLHDAFWSVGEQGFTNVSHGCVNMSPADAEIFYKMADPGDPVKVVGSPKAGTWDNGWTMWFLTWKQWVHGSALHEAVLAGPHGSTPVGASASVRPGAKGRPTRPRTQREAPPGSVSL